MHIDKLMEEMQKLKETGETEVIVAWWTRPDYFHYMEKNEFDAFADHCDNKVDWSDANDQIEDLLTEWQDEE